MMMLSVCLSVCLSVRPPLCAAVHCGLTIQVNRKCLLKNTILHLLTSCNCLIPKTPHPQISTSGIAMLIKLTMAITVPYGASYSNNVEAKSKSAKSTIGYSATAGLLVQFTYELFLQLPMICSRFVLTRR